MERTPRSHDHRFIIALFFAINLCAIGTGASAQTEAFYSSKTVRILVGATPSRFYRHIFQGGPKRDARLAEGPTLFELLDQYKAPAIMRSLTRMCSPATNWAGPMLAGPSVPADRIRGLREAYAKAMRDSALIEEAKKGQMDLEHTSGEELQLQIKEILSQPREVIDLV